MMKKIILLVFLVMLIPASMIYYSYLQNSGSIPTSSGIISKWSYILSSSLGNRSSVHALASIRVFNSTNPSEQILGFEQLQREYEEGSYYSAGKLGWAYQKGLGVDQDLQQALNLYEEAASHGMTYWQFLLAHAYQEGYLGLDVSPELYEYWLNNELRVHIAKYECWVTTYYEDGTFPNNPEKENQFRTACESDT